jgi:uncharacterized membrane protein
MLLIGRFKTVHDCRVLCTEREMKRTEDNPVEEHEHTRFTFEFTCSNLLRAFLLGLILIAMIICFKLLINVNSPHRHRGTEPLIRLNTPTLLSLTRSTRKNQAAYIVVKNWKLQDQKNCFQFFQILKLQKKEAKKPSKICPKTAKKNEKKIINSALSQKYNLKKKVSRRHRDKHIQGQMENHTYSRMGSKTQEVKIQKKTVDPQIHLGDQVLKVPTNSPLSPNDSCHSRARDSLSTNCEPGLSIIPTPKGMLLIGRFKTVHDCRVLCTEREMKRTEDNQVEEHEHTRFTFEFTCSNLLRAFLLGLILIAMIICFKLLINVNSPHRHRGTEPLIRLNTPTLLSLTRSTRKNQDAYIVVKNWKLQDQKNCFQFFQILKLQKKEAKKPSKICPFF